MADKISVSVSDIYGLSPVGSLDSTVGDTLFGFNHRQTPSPVSINQDRYGFTFFTRPQLNMVSENICMDRHFNPLLTNNIASIQRAIRAYLDPRWNQDGNECSFVDSQNIFIPLLTNHLTDISGWPDITLETFDAKEGAYKETFSYADSVSDIFSSYTLTANFRNMIGDPISRLFEFWVRYISCVTEGTMVPYADYMMRNIVDYQTRIYRLVMDKTNTYVQKIAACGVAYPIGISTGKSFDFSNEMPMNLTNNEISIQFKTVGAMYNDVLLIHQFNKAVSIGCLGMRSGSFAAIMQKIPYSALSIFNGIGYPRINPTTYELEWYVTKMDYSRVIGSYTSTLKALGYDV